MMHGRRRVVITGMGVIAPNGHDLNAFWNSVRNGESAGAPVTRFDTANLPHRIAAEVSGFDARRYMDPKTARRLDRSSQYAVAAARLAMEDGGLNFADYDPERVGVAEGTTVSNNEMAFRSEEQFSKKGYRGLSPYTLINGYNGGGSGEISNELGITGHSITCSTGSASGNDAVGYGFNMILNDQADVMVAGGAEAPLLAPLWGAFCLSRVMTSRNENPKRAMRPFDKTRDGFLLGEGAAFLLLEELSFAQGRGARIYAEVLGHGRSCEAFHPVAPHPEGVGVVRAIEKALQQSGVHVSEIDYINAHGTATDLSDAAETKAIRKLFGGYESKLAVSSTKPVTGHLLAGAGALESVVCALAIQHQEIPMTLNFNECNDGCPLDFVKGASRPYPLRHVLNLSSGFGGKNACVLLGRYSTS
jgi:3-oxoacyl-[acyl-carrier-protein] synthase II